MATRASNAFSGTLSSRLCSTTSLRRVPVKPAPASSRSDVVCYAMHPDAEKREQERLRRQQETQAQLELEKAGAWWYTPAELNVQFHSTPRKLLSILASQSISHSPTVLHFFNKACPGCKAMHPKLQQIIERNSDFCFHAVCVEKEHAAFAGKHWNVQSLPYFLVFMNGTLVSEFTCNLVTIDRLRSSLRAARGAIQPLIEAARV